VATAEERLKIIVEASDRASAIVQGMARSVANAVNDITAAFSDLSTATGGIFSAYMIRQAAEYQIELAKTAAEVDRVRDAFRNLQGTDATQTLDQLRAASRGTIADLDLMLSANKAMMLEVAQDADTLSRLMVVAMERGRAMGRSASESFTDIVTGIGRLSPWILDNLGIVTGGEAAYAQYAETLGKTVEQLTAAEKRQMLLNKVLEFGSAEAQSAGRAILDAAAQYERLDAQVANLKANLGGLATLGTGLPISIIVAATATELQAANSAFDRMRGHRETLADLRKEVWANRDAIGGWNTALLLAGTLIQELNVGTGLTKDGTDALTDAAQRQMAQMMGNEAMTRAMVGRYSELEAAARGAADGTDELTEAELRRAILTGKQAGYGMVGGLVPGQEGALRSQAASDALDLYLQREEENRKKLENAIELGQRAGTGAIGAIMGGTEGERRSQAASDLLDLTLAQAEATGKVNDAEFAYQLSTRDTAGQIELLTQKLSTLDEGSVEYYNTLTRIQNLQNSMAKSGAKLYDQSIAEMRSLAESLLQPTGVTALDMAQTKLGTYTDKWDEYARRVRAAGNDVKSEWRNLVPVEILQQGEDAIKAWTAAEEEAFYSGQRPQEVNWDSFIENARREVERQLARENLVNEAMARLAEAGIGGVSRAQVAAQFGVMNTGAVGTDAATQLSDGMKLVNVGKAYTESFDTQFRAEEERWLEMGKLSVTWISSGVVKATNEGAADRLVKYLYDALLPKLQVALQGYP